jgi:hypothetical protein
MESEHIVSIRAKLSRAGIKTASLLRACEAQDGNQDGLVHIDDLESVLVELLVGSGNAPSKREMRALQSSMTSNKDRVEALVEYQRLQKILAPRETRREEERWYDGNSAAGTARRVGYAGEDYWAQQRGSVGEWLTNAACPSEVKNFKKLIAHLERFERETGVAIETTTKGSLVIPLGPDLQVTMNFSNRP